MFFSLLKFLVSPNELIQQLWIMSATRPATIREKLLAFRLSWLFVTIKTAKSEELAVACNAPNCFPSFYALHVSVVNSIPSISGYSSRG